MEQSARVSPSVAESMMVFAFGVYLARPPSRSLGLVCMTDLLTAPCLLSLFDLFRLSPQHGQKDRESHIQRLILCQGIMPCFIKMLQK